MCSHTKTHAHNSARARPNDRVCPDIWHKWLAVRRVRNPFGPTWANIGLRSQKFHGPRSRGDRPKSPDGVPSRSRGEPDPPRTNTSGAVAVNNAGCAESGAICLGDPHHDVGAVCPTPHSTIRDPPELAPLQRPSSRSAPGGTLGFCSNGAAAIAQGGEVLLLRS